MKRKWWKEAIGYQIYPRSFMDSNEDGIGDIPGIISKLDYLNDLGIDVIWVCPFYKSPNDDNGYDISDYKEIMSDFGTMNDFDNLLREVHNRGMKLIVDLVVNHTSDEHPWFIESRSSKNNPKRDWYIWREGKDGREPNNWESIFKGSVWELDKKTEEYYLHLFTKRQPDLNWENEEVRNEIYNMINWWLDKGIDGFRVDAISHIKKEPGLKDMPNPNNEKYVSSFDKHMNVEGVQAFLKELKENTFDKYDIMTVGEANGVSSKNAEEWVGEKEGKFSMVFQFEHLDLWNNANDEKFDVRECKKVLSSWQNSLENDGWNALFIENHDITRAVSSWGNDKEYWKESSKALGLMYFMQKGTPFIYQGQEIGMTNVNFKSVDEYNDIKGINDFKKNLSNGMDKEKAFKIMAVTSRDNARTPMQWDATQNAGFTKGTPWINVADNYNYINVEKELKSEDSILNFYKKMIKLKKESLTLTYGKYELILADDENIYAYERILEEEKYIIITNLSEKNVKYSYNKAILNSSKLLLSNYNVQEHGDITECDLRPYEARLYKVK
ncbi:glycoside hydrolase family 13 protein [Clostridium chauvoei]|uniref:Alpha-amylase n=2 Tax=Clostridium chauvoei TaxID=46867 RepID=S6FBK9_9CLOT|nr:alpha-glucosidase [Clostridium chauvoei]ATD55719.1 glucohydrolase [Clostridium chauvoei]ATD56604.1 glucohydrolase [Clostridium chauvoei]MBX7280264.1 alpha-glucosidase [Clostridium chauvoei]MBX7282749.1 alpha-glucosidase [Clostridium chauvoei]MBX7285155.1 alpha-glucosidase [Clostridium chauvoei]